MTAPLTRRCSLLTPPRPASVAQLVRADGYSSISGATLALSAWDGDTSSWVVSVATATTDSRGYANVSLYPTDLLADAAVSRLASSYKASGGGASLSRMRRHAALVRRPYVGE